MTINEILALLKKSAIDTAAGGNLPEEKAKQFIDLVISQNALMAKIQSVQMTSSKYTLSTIDIASRQMRKGVEGTSPTNKVGVTITPRSLNYNENIIPFDITFSFLEENIEGQNAESKINEMFAKSFGNDLLDLAINGDTSLAEVITDANSDGLDDTTGLSQNDHSFLTQDNGWLKLMRADATVNTYTIPADLSGAGAYASVLKNVLNNMPNKWKTNPEELVFLVSPDFATNYTNELAARNTALGDKYTIGGGVPPYQGIEIAPIAFFPGNGTTHYPQGPVVVLTKYKNLAVGIGRNMRVGRQIQERPRIVEYTITAKTAFNYVVGEMIVLAEKA